MKNIIRLVSVVCLSVLGLTGLCSERAFAARKPPKALERQEVNKIRAAYWMVKPAKQGKAQLQLLKKNGLNTALLKDSRYHIQERLLKQWGELAEQENLQFFPVFNFAGKNEMKFFDGKFLSYVDRHGTAYPATPCPLDSRYWELSVGRRLQQIASLAKKTGIIGALFDTEMYGSELHVYKDTCFCNHCWQKFLKSITQPQPSFPIPPNRRLTYLSEQQLRERYTAFQENEVRQILSEIEQQVHKVEPSFALGFLAFKANWFYRGLIQGLGTPSNPVNVFSETTYVSGFTPHVDDEKIFITGLPQFNVHKSTTSIQTPSARYIPGLWLGRFFPEELPSQLAALKGHTDGYWLYSADSLWDNEDKTEPLTLHGKASEYWEALKLGNRAAYSQDFPTLYQSSRYDTSRNHLTPPSSLQSLLTTEAFNKFLQGRQLSGSSSESITLRGKALIHGLSEAKGMIHLRHIPLTTEPAYTDYTVFNREGECIQTGRLDRQRPSIILSTTELNSEFFSLLLNSGSHATELRCSALPCVIEASRTFPLRLFKTAHTFGLYFPTDFQWLYLRAYSSGEESALLTVRSPDLSILEEKELVGYTELKVPGPRLKNLDIKKRLGSLSVTPVPSKLFEDVKLYFLNEALPYLLPHFVEKEP